MAKVIRNSTVYGLVDPRDHQVKYVGKTNDIKHRMYMHIFHAKQTVRQQPVYKWMRELLAAGMMPDMVRLTEDLTEKQAFQFEKKWIKFYKDINELMNMNEGGKGFAKGNAIWKNKNK